MAYTRIISSSMVPGHHITVTETKIGDATVACDYEGDIRATVCMRAGEFDQLRDRCGIPRPGNFMRLWNAILEKTSC